MRAFNRLSIFVENADCSTSMQEAITASERVHSRHPKLQGISYKNIFDTFFVRITYRSWFGLDKSTVAYVSAGSTHFDLYFYLFITYIDAGGRTLIWLQYAGSACQTRYRGSRYPFLSAWHPMMQTMDTSFPFYGGLLPSDGKGAPAPRCICSRQEQIIGTHYT